VPQNGEVGDWDKFLVKGVGGERALVVEGGGALVVLSLIYSDLAWILERGVGWGGGNLTSLDRFREIWCTSCEQVPIILLGYCYKVPPSLLHISAYLSNTISFTIPPLPVPLVFAHSSLFHSSITPFKKLM
jgi:hypothetical protein